MNSGLQKRLLALPAVNDLEPTYNDINKIINNTIFLDSQIEKPGRSNRHNINFVLVSYAVALQNEATPTTI